MRGQPCLACPGFLQGRREVISFLLHVIHSHMHSESTGYKTPSHVQIVVRAKLDYRASVALVSYAVDNRLSH